MPKTKFFILTRQELLGSVRELLAEAALEISVELDSVAHKNGPWDEEWMDEDQDDDGDNDTPDESREVVRIMHVYQEVPPPFYLKILTLSTNSDNSSQLCQQQDHCVCLDQNWQAHQ